MEYMTVKIPKNAKPLLCRFQAECMLETGAKVSEAQAIKKALEDAFEHKKEKRQEKKYSLKDLKGIVKGGPRTNATEEIDSVVYGI
ncbi:hypothetical protein HZC09_04860 [Candidatus Micrarchaeota archaeon]|nr:hypothetical protein [Candidatus Micrarchaeota archaeon]